MEKKFELVAPFKPMGDQVAAIDQLVTDIETGKQAHCLLGVTGSGKTFTVANTVERLNRPTLIIAHNKTLAAQLYGELKDFFPNNAVEYFVSYYDYYQPEAYVVKSDTFIEKDAAINEQIDRMRHSATTSLLTRRDVIIVASVSCIYGIGTSETYQKMCLGFEVGEEISRKDLTRQLVDAQYKRNDNNFIRGCFRVRGETVDVFPSNQEKLALRIEFFDDEIESLSYFDPITGEVLEDHNHVLVFPNSHYVTPRDQILRAMEQIREDLRIRLKEFKNDGKLLEYQRLESRTMHDLELLETAGICNGIENYSRYLSGRKPGVKPPTLVEYFPDDFLLVIDESHVTVPQIRAMYNGDRARKTTLVDHGFRLPSALDNRPLMYDEFLSLTPSTLYVSATPAPYEIERSEGVLIEQIIRPTGLLDPVIEICPTKNQIDDIISKINKVIENGNRVLLTTLTKRFSEEICDYLSGVNIKASYLHSDIETIDRVRILQELREGKFDVLVGINLLREGLDLPEVEMVIMLDADKQGFLRSQTSLIQTFGRAARNAQGKVVLYADDMSDAMKLAIEETDRRRAIQAKYNEEHNITPKTVKKGDFKLPLIGKLEARKEEKSEEFTWHSPVELRAKIGSLKKDMWKAAEDLDFEKAANLRDEIKGLEDLELSI